jgi:polygalacturonase
VVRNVVAKSIRNVGIGVAGASKISGSYLDNPPAHDNPLGLGPNQQSDLIDFVLDRFSLNGSRKNYGISTSAASARISNGTLTGFQRGIVTTQECTKFVIDAVKIFDSASFGIQVGQGVTVHTPPRLADGVIRNCVIAGSGTQGRCAGLAVGTTRSCLIEDCRFGYDKSMDDKSEATQTQAVTAAADASGVICRNNYVAPAADGAVAYVLAGAAGRGCRIENPRGIQTANGAWR